VNFLENGPFLQDSLELLLLKPKCIVNSIRLKDLIFWKYWGDSLMIMNDIVKLEIIYYLARILGIWDRVAGLAKELIIMLLNVH